MATDDHGLETIRKAGEELIPGDKSDYVIKTVDDGRLNKIEERQSSSLSFVGRTRGDIADTDVAQWQISRIVSLNGTTNTEYANNGKFDQIWDNRESIFPAVVFDNPASLLFDGSDEYITIGNNYGFGPAIAFSWSFWFKANNFASQRAFLAKTTQDANVYGYSFQHNSSGQLFTQFRASGTLRNHTFTTVMTSGTWYHICFTYAGGSNMNGLRAYINASVEPTPSSNSIASWTHTDPFYFASRGGTFFFSGNMNQIAVYDKALSASEVSAIYNGGSPTDLTFLGSAVNLQSLWLLNNNANFPTEVDQVGSVNGTLVNMKSTDYDTGDVP